LYDADLKGLSAEAIYDRIVTDLRRYRKLATLKGIGQCDILERGVPEWWDCSEGMDLDDFYRRCLAQGLVYHQEAERGYLPAGLIEEIADQVQVKGRGGTVLQPGINLLDKAEDFPSSTPLLIITDGYCDRLSIRREHAFLLPTGSSLPFVPRGEVLRIK
jgi:hypothetical protein